MCALPHPTGVGVENKGTVKDGIQNAVYRVMDNPIPHSRLVDVSPLGVGEVESSIVSMPVGFWFVGRCARKRDSFRGVFRTLVHPACSVCLSETLASFQKGFQH